jgi:hypothetical protein
MKKRIQDAKTLVRFWSKVSLPNKEGCRTWTACKFAEGYGWFCYKGKSFRAHRVAWILLYGPIPKGLHVCHHCDTPSCCEPTHLFLGTHTENMKDAVLKGRRCGLTEERLAWVRHHATSNRYTQTEISNILGTSQPNISRIISKELARELLSIK